VRPSWVGGIPRGQHQGQPSSQRREQNPARFPRNG
jgi:hypothetical protein